MVLRGVALSARKTFNYARTRRERHIARQHDGGLDKRIGQRQLPYPRQYSVCPRRWRVWFHHGTVIEAREGSAQSVASCAGPWFWSQDSNVWKSGPLRGWTAEIGVVVGFSHGFERKRQRAGAPKTLREQARASNCHRFWSAPALWRFGPGP